MRIPPSHSALHIPRLPMRRLPLFPLPLVLLPGVPLPLHVFEPRYRQMVAHCLETDRRFGLLYHDPDRSGPFEMEPGRVGCVAEIREFQPLPDGRSMLEVQGLERFRLEDGIESSSMYYEGLVDEYPDLPEDEAEVARRQTEAWERFGYVLRKLDVGSLPPLVAEAPVSFQMARWIQIDPSWKQQLLEARSELQRLEQIDVLVRDAMEEAG